MSELAEPGKQIELLPIQRLVNQQFNNVFKSNPELLVSSPGRINLIGEHTDYNLGFVLPAAIDKQINLAISKRNDDQLHFYAVDFDSHFEGSINNLDRSPSLWPDYINGVLDQLQKRGLQFQGLNIAVGGDIPAGAGLSSSAALECATCFAVNELFGFGLSRLEMVKISQAAENEFVGVKCGIMDQFASMFGKMNNALLLDCRSLNHEYVPLELDEYVILLLDTRVKHSLASGEYNIRREQCEEGVKQLKKVYPDVKSLRDANRAMIEYSLKDNVDEVIYNRCKYVVEENLRLQAGCELLRRNDIIGFGKKMYESHAGLSNLYEVSCKELDYLVELALEEPGIAGARMMGGGFGGCTINIVRKSLVNEIVERISESFHNKFGQPPLAHICNLSDGTHVVSTDIK